MARACHCQYAMFAARTVFFSLARRHKCPRFSAIPLICYKKTVIL